MTASDTPRPVDTLSEPHEPVVTPRCARRLWVHLLAGPVIWMPHFLSVYLLAEWVCANRPDSLGDRGLEATIVVLTAAASAVALFAAWRALRAARGADGDLLHRAGCAMSVSAAALVWMVGIPVLFLDAC